MTDEELLEMQVLAAARKAFAPDAHAAERVLAATEQALLAPSATPPASGPMEILVHAPGLGLRLVAAGVLSVASGIVGYILAPSSVAPSPIATAITATAASPTPVAPQSDSLRQLSAASPPAVPPTFEYTSTPSMLESTKPQITRARVIAVRRKPAPFPDLSITEQPSLMRELQRLKEVETALRGEDYGEAARLLNLLDREVPAGKMMEERDAAFTVTLCAQGLGDPSRLARTYAANHPQSVYWERVHNRCKVDDND